MSYLQMDDFRTALVVRLQEVCSDFKIESFDVYTMPAKNYMANASQWYILSQVP